MGLDIYVRFFLGFAFTISLIGVVYWVARRYAGRLGIMGSHATGRLSVTGQISLDPRRRVMLVRCDDREHLLLLGPNNDLVIDSSASAGSFHSALQAAGANPGSSETGEQA